MASGRYNILFTWLQHSRGEANGFGEQPEEYTSQGNLWGAVDDASANVEPDLDADRQHDRATVRILNHPGLKPLDRLTCTRHGLAEVWRIETVHREATQTICDVEAVV